MKKFMVMVNSKFMVMVEANSCYGAEHIILDDVYYGMRTALAFDEDSMKTGQFVACLMSCQTISLDELKELSGEYEQEMNDVGTAYAEVIKAEAALEAAQKALKAAEVALAEANKAHQDAQNIHDRQCVNGLLEKVRS